MDRATDICVDTLFFAYNLYATLIVGPLAWIFLPLTKWYVNRRCRRIGLELNGKRPIDPQIKSNKAYVRLVQNWSLGYCESWVNKEIEIEDTLGAAVTMLRTRRMLELEHPLNFIFTWFNLQTSRKAFEVGKEHYDISTDLYEKMLDKNMQYSCGYWKDAKTIDQAQEDKLHLIAKKLKLRKGMRLLDIGSGWGGLARFMAKNYGVSVVGYTISKEQKDYAEKLCKGLPVEFRLDDYRTINEKFDAVVSVGMMEHVGQHNYREYFQTVNRALDDKGLFLLHTMGISHHTTPHNTLWVHKYIFKNGFFPHHSSICKSLEELFIIEDWHNFGHHYYLTFKAWYDNIEKEWPQMEKTYGERFRRIWTLYLITFMAGFKSRSVQLWQIVLSKNGLEGGYESIR